MNKVLELIKDKKVAVFDLDGTIADTETYHWLAHKMVLKKLKLIKKLWEKVISIY